ncbi:MAG: phosphatidate cytidylyltransferase [Gammaproteobacteria bacterium]|nr:phosphatidate cytidylyltransferase [Gammaproteobacteria bacterium]
MLKKRILTALVLVPPLIAALFYLPSVGVAALFGVFVGVGAWEWATLSELRGMCRVGYVATVLAIGSALLALTFHNSDLATVVFAVAALWWLWVVVDLRRDVSSFYHARVGKIIAGFLVLTPAWVAVSVLHAVDPQRPLALLFVLVLVGLADTAAYAAGRAFGRTKLAPSISPGKTVEGVIGALLVVLLLAYFCGTILWKWDGLDLVVWLVLAFVVALISVVGDLAESKLKRIAGVKDSGSLLPGHGGVLDRIDAITAAAPVFALGWLLWFD